jgi:NADPH2:quinone reductase
MKGILVSEFGGFDVLKYEEVPDPVVEPDQVLVSVRAASVNYADIKARSGSYHLGKKPPFSPGLDVAGVVLEVGAEVTGIEPGNHVIAFPSAGSYVEKAVAQRDLTFVIPSEIDFTEAAAAALVSGTATHMLTHLAAVETHESLLVHAAAGGVGTAALQVAKALGLTEVYGSIGSPWKGEHVRRMGARGVIDYLAENYFQDINELTEGRGVDVILNPLGSVTVERDLHCLAPFGRLIIFGELMDGPSILAQSSLYPVNRSIIGCSFGHYRRARPAVVKETMNTAIELLADKRLDVVVSACLPLEQAGEAHRLLENKKVVGKIVLVPGGSG